MMLCHCGGDSRVLDSRPSVGRVRRRRECLVCGARWTTQEFAADLGRTLAAMRGSTARLDRLVRKLSASLAAGGD